VNVLPAHLSLLQFDALEQNSDSSNMSSLDKVRPGIGGPVPSTGTIMPTPFNPVSIAFTLVSSKVPATELSPFEHEILVAKSKSTHLNFIAPLLSRALSLCDQTSTGYKYVFV
jgi:hypothetical protein